MDGPNPYPISGNSGSIPVFRESEQKSNTPSERADKKVLFFPKKRKRNASQQDLVE